jgi:B12-binding domain/radical SAM domain protein
VAIGEGEATICDVFHALRRGADPRALRGIAHVDAGGRFVTHGPGDRRPLDDYPAFNVRHGKWNAIEITRGCIYACAFCQTPFMFKARFRHRSVASVKEQLSHMVAQGGGKFVRFVTPTSLSYGAEGEAPDLAKVEELLAAVRGVLGPDGKIYFGTFPSEVRPEHVTPEALAILKRWVDNTTLVIGGQSGSERVLEATRRGHGVDAIVRAVEASNAAGFRPDVDFLLGVPGETREDREASIRLAERLVAMGARIHSHAFMPLPGTPLRDGAPEPIEPHVERAMQRMESRGAMYGQYKRQLVTAQELVRMRRA